MGAHVAFSENSHSHAQQQKLVSPLVRSTCTGTFDFIEQSLRCRIQSYTNPIHTSLAQKPKILATQRLARNRNLHRNSPFQSFNESGNAAEDFRIVQSLNADTLNLLCLHCFFELFENGSGWKSRP